MCLITGGAGFIGSHLTDALAKKELNNTVIVLDNLSTGKLANIVHHFNRDEDLDRAYANTNKKEEQKKQEDNNTISGDHVTFIKADITNLALLQNIFQKYRPDYVFHLAAIASVPKSIKDPLTTHNVNVTGTLNTLLAAKEAGTVKKFVFSSSCAIYGNPSEDHLPLKETQPPDPLSPYATSKLIGEQYCNIFSKTYNLPTVSLRYFNVYGPRQDPNSEYAAVIPKFISRIKQGKPLIIYGDGTQTRDFIYVGDVVNANIALATSNDDGYDIFNVGTGEETSISFLANPLLSILGKDLEHIEYKPKRVGDIHDSFADNTKFEHILQHVGFEPPLDLTNGLIDTVEIDEEDVLIV